MFYPEKQEIEKNLFSDPTREPIGHEIKKHKNSQNSNTAFTDNNALWQDIYTFYGYQIINIPFCYYSKPIVL